MKFLTLFSDRPGCWSALPDSVGLPSDRPLYLPDFPDGAAFIPMIAVRISRLGKCIEARFADRYYDAVAPAIQILPATAAEDALAGIAPPSSSSCFDCAVVCGHFADASRPGPLSFSFILGDDRIGDAMSDPARTSLAIEILSLTNTLKTGDIILLPALNPRKAVPGRELVARCGTGSSDILSVRFK